MEGNYEVAPVVDDQSQGAIERIEARAKRNVAPQDRGKYPGPSGLQTAAGFGIPIALLAGGPIGLAAGAAFGLVSHLRKNAWLDAEARQASAVQENQNEYQAIYDREYEEAKAKGDKGTMEMMEDLDAMKTIGKNNWMAGDPNGLMQMHEAMSKVMGISATQIAERKQKEAAQFETEKGFVITGANALRQQRQGVLDIYDEAELLANKQMKTLADTKDVDAPQSRAILTDMLGLMASAGYRDQRDALDALTEGIQGVGGGGIVADIVKTGVDVGTALWKTSKNWDKEQWYRMTFNFQNAMRQTTADKLKRISDDTDSLNVLGQKSGAVSQGYNFHDYIDGGKDDIPLAPQMYAPTVEEVQTMLPKMHVPNVGAPRTTGRGPRSNSYTIPRISTNGNKRPTN